tara:strand:+ start:4231 stop:5139 length:909 start_codon:yes stop_codon:yes gene_type:complete
MAKELREVIKNITTQHLKKYKSFVFGQNLTGVGWVAGTLPRLYEKDGVIELPTSDVASGGFVTGAALMKKKPIYIIRYQGFNWFNCIFIINYASKSKEIWKVPSPILVRGMSQEGSIGPVAGSSQISIFYKMPGIKIVSPMTPKEYIKAYRSFERDNDVYYFSEHRDSYNRIFEFSNLFMNKSDIVILPISVTRLHSELAQRNLTKQGYKISIFHIVWLKPFKINKKLINTINNSKHGAIIFDNDFEDGMPSILAGKLQKLVNKKINVKGLKNKTAGHHPKFDNLPPRVHEIEQIIKKIIKR